MLIITIGLARSGKDTFAKYLVANYGFEHFDFYRDVVVPEMRKRGFKPSKENASIFGDEMRKKFGNGVFGRIMAELIKSSQSKNIVITGARSVEEIDEIKKVEKPVLVCISAPLKERYKRAVSEKNISYEEFLKRDERDLKNKGLAKLLKLCEFKIENNSTLEEFYSKIDKFMRELAK